MCGTIDIFSDIFAFRDNALTRMDARVKLLLAMECLVCVVLSQQAVFPLAMWTFCLTVSLAVRIPWRVIVLRLTAPTAVVLVMAVLQSILRGTTPLWVLNLGVAKVVMTKEGVQAGLLTGTRVFGAVSVVFLLSVVTPVHRIFQAMHWFRVPKDWLEIASLMYRYLFTLIDVTMDMAAAQRLRLGYRGTKRSVRSMSELIGIAIIRSLDQAVRTHEAMALRGYNGNLRFGLQPAFSQSDLWVLALCGTLVPSLFFLCERNLL